MADERELQEQEVDGVDEGDSQESALPTADETAERQPEKSKFNLDESPEFRQWKSAADKRLAETERRYQQQLEQQQAALREKQLAGLDDYERVQFELQEERQARASLVQRLQEVETQAARATALQEVSQEMGVPVDVIIGASDLNDAWRLAARYNKQSEAQREADKAKAAAERAKAREGKAERNQVDLGSGTPIPSNDAEREYQKVLKSRNTRSIFSHALGSQ